MLASHLLETAELALPGLDVSTARTVLGEFHDVVVVPQEAVVKIARGAAVNHLRRRAELLRRLSQVGLPFAVPAPLGDVVELGDRSAVALSWVPGGEPAGPVAPRALHLLLAALAAVPLVPLQELLDEPHAYAGRGAWPELMLDEVVPLLPAHVRAEAARRVHAALALLPVPARLVHGDLAGANVRWHRDGTVAAVVVRLKLREPPRRR